MLPDVTLPASLSALLAVFAPCFTARSFRTFCALACGFVGQTGKRTVCGMLTADMIAKLRRVLIAAKFRSSHRDQPTPEEIQVIRLAWETPAA